MKYSAIMGFPSRGRPVWRVLQTIEATIGALFAFLVGFVLLVLGGNILYFARGDPAFKLLCPAWAIAVVLESAFLYRLKAALEIGRYPFAPWFALQMRRWPLPLRPLAVAWWAAHFLLGIAASIALENLVVADAVTWNVRVLRCLIFIAVGSTIAYSANLYALLAITAGGGGERLVRQAWRWRVILDIGVAVTAALFPIFVRPR